MKTSAPRSGVDPASTIAALTDPQRDKVCAWAAAVYGGFGCQSGCDDKAMPLHKSPPICRVNLVRPKCQATVADLERCIEKDAENMCAMALLDAPECEAWKTCMFL